ncbi:MAG: protein kinase, partial [Myxococcota bacterium]
MRLANGTTIGEYQVTGVLGQGAFGTVYAAIHPVIGKKAAVKVLKRDAADSPEMATRFKYEARSVNAIEHPNIVDIFGFGTLDDGRPYLIMEYLNGGHLQALIRAQGGRLPAELAFPILRDVAAAVDAAHSRGIVHRDLKPENIFIAEYADAPHRVKVLDFGIAKILTGSMAATDEGTQMGTPLFMAPEQCFGHPIDHRIDIYAFGVIAFHCLTGGFPVYADTVIALVGQHMMGERTLPSEYGPEFARYDEVLGRCLAAESEHRFASLREAYQALTAAHGGISSSAPLVLSTPLAQRSSSSSAPSGLPPARSSMAMAQTDPALGGPSSSPRSSGYPAGPASTSTTARSKVPVLIVAAIALAIVAGGIALAIFGKQEPLSSDAGSAELTDASAPAEASAPADPALTEIKRAIVGQHWRKAIAAAQTVLEADPDHTEADALLERITEAADALVVGLPDDAPAPFMG